MQRVLITGINGFAGSVLADRLLGEAEVWGTYLVSNFDNISEIERELALVQCNLLDAERAGEVVRESRPDVVFHLAAQSAPSLSYADPASTLETNIFSTLNLLEAVAKYSPGSVFLNVGSSDEYGAVSEDELPVGEGAELRPQNPYSVSKVSQEMLGYQYFKTNSLKVIRCRPFNHLGAGQSEHFVASSFAKQIAEIEAGINPEPVIRVGNLAPLRDFQHVKDVVSAYTILAERGVAGEAYNICSGRGTPVEDLLTILLGFSETNINVLVDKERFRPVDSPVIYGDPSRLKALGWEPVHSIEAALGEVLDYWRGKVREGAG